MTPLRLVGVVVLVFLLSLPAMQKRLPDFLTCTDNSSEAEGDDRDDPAVDMLCLKGLVYLGKEQFDKAIAAYSEAIDRDPKYSFAYIGRGNAYAAKGDLDHALLDFDKAARLDPNDDTAKTLADMIREQRDRK
jgi:tetratricopeptide (TPR) repeat protein